MPTRDATRPPALHAPGAPEAELLWMLGAHQGWGTLTDSRVRCAALLGIALETARTSDTLLANARRDAEAARDALRAARALWADTADAGPARQEG